MSGKGRKGGRKGNHHAKGRLPASAGSAPKARRPAPADRQKKPHFCFEHADRSSTNTWAFTPNAADSAEILTFVCEMACLSWGEIEAMQVGPSGKRKPKHHYQGIDTVDAAAQEDLVRRKLADTFGDAPLFRFRLSGKKRLWGFRTERIFHVVWWDWNHKVCPQS